MKPLRGLSYVVVFLSMILIIGITIAAQPLPVQGYSRNPGTQPIQSSVQADSSLANANLSAYVNQPWDWVEGTAAAGAQVQAHLLRNGTDIAQAQVTANVSGAFALLFVKDQQPVDILEGDLVSLSDGTNSVEIVVIQISGTINVADDSISGQMVGGSFPTTAMIGVSRPSDPTFTTKPLAVAADGTFTASFAGEVNLVDGYVAKIWYTDLNGNQVRKILYSNGLDVRTRLNENFVEGVTVPGTQVQITVKDSGGTQKGIATCTADRTGHYATQIFNNNAPVDIIVTDSVNAMALGKSIDVQINVVNHSQIDAVNDKITGTLSGGTFPAIGRINLWNAKTANWYFKDITIDNSGNYTADFSGVADVNAPDKVRVWYIDPNGNEIASLTTGLEVGVSTTANSIWGYTVSNGTVHGLIKKNTDGSEHNFDWAANADGYFMADFSSQLTLAPQDQVTISEGGNQVIFTVSDVKIQSRYSGQTILIQGIPNSVLQVLIQRTGANYWKEVSVGADGKVLLTLDGSYTIKPMDRLDLNFYIEDHGLTVHQAFTLDYSLFLPKIEKH